MCLQVHRAFYGVIIKISQDFLIQSFSSWSSLLLMRSTVSLNYCCYFLLVQMTDNNSTWISNNSRALYESNNIHSTDMCVEMYTNSGKNRRKLNDRSVSQFLLHRLVVLPCKIFILLFISLSFLYACIFVYILFYWSIHHSTIFIFVFNYCDRAISQSKFDGINSINLILKLMILYQSSRKKTVICTKKNKNLCEFWSDKWPFNGELFLKTQCNATSCEDGRCQETINNITVNVVLREKGAKVSSLVLKLAKSCHSKSGQVLHTRGV